MPPKAPTLSKGEALIRLQGVCQGKGGARVGVQNQGLVLLPGLQGANHQSDCSHSTFQSDIREHLQLSELCTVVAAQASCQGHRPLPLLPEHSRRPLQITVGAGPLAPPPRLPSPAGPRRHPPLPGLPSVRRRGCWASCLRGSGVAEGPGLLPQISRWWGAPEYPLVPSVRPGRPRGCRGALPPPHPRNL